MKTAFLANMSHEIRTPLNSIVGMAELLSRNDLPGKTMEQILSIKQAGNHLLSIVNDVLDFSKIESGKLEVHEAPYQFASLINDVINIINIRLIDKGLVFTASIDPKIPSVMKGDEIRLRQVLLNVLGNAVKFTERGRIGLNISRRSGGSDEVVLIMEISDTGPGIGDEGMARLFDAFAQVDVHTRNAVEGTGLGLAITKSLVESMRGSITVRSELGRGSTFALEIPQGLLEDKPMVGGDGLASVSILLLEPDNVGATSFLQACLQLGLTCQRRNTPADMAETLSRERFTHVMIPYTCLNEALQAMYRTQSTAQLVVMTAFGELSRISGVKAVSLPVYALNLANVLTGNEESCRPTGGDLTTFVAPDSRVLVVDDIVTNLKVAEGLLSTYQLRIDTCTSGEAAIRHIKETDYDIVFMDHMMPGMDGIETVARIREKGEESSRCRDVTIIALTANVISGTREKFLAAGFNDFLAKPIEMSKMSAVLHKWLPRSKRIERSDKPLSTDQAPEIEGIDTLSGLRHSGGSLDRYMSVLRVYLSDGREISRRLEGGITNRDLALVELYAHSIKSASANIGAFDLSSRAGEIERTARSSESDFSWDEAKGVLENYHKLLGTVSRFIAARRDGGNSAPDIAPRLNELEEALSRFEMGRVDDIVQELMSCNFPEEVRSRLEKLEEEILISSYDSAKEQIAILKKELGIC